MYKKSVNLKMYTQSSWANLNGPTDLFLRIISPGCSDFQPKIFLPATKTNIFSYFHCKLQAKHLMTLIHRDVQQENTWKSSPPLHYRKDSFFLTDTLADARIEATRILNMVKHKIISSSRTFSIVRTPICLFFRCYIVHVQRRMREDTSSWSCAAQRSAPAAPACSAPSSSVRPLLYSLLLEI